MATKTTAVPEAPNTPDSLNWTSVTDEEIDGAFPEYTTIHNITVTPGEGEEPDTVVDTVKLYTEWLPAYKPEGEFAVDYSEEFVLADGSNKKYLCLMDGMVYRIVSQEVGFYSRITQAWTTPWGPTSPGTKVYRTEIALVGSLTPRITRSWDLNKPTDGAATTDDNFPDASYFGVGPIGLDPLDETGRAVEPYYVYVDGDHKIAVFNANTRSPNGTLAAETYYAAISTAGKSFTPVLAGATASTTNLDKVLARTVEQDYSVAPSVDGNPLVPLSTYSAQDKIGLGVFYNLVTGTKSGDAWVTNSLKWTAIGVAEFNRYTVDKIAEPADNKFTLDVDGNIVPAVAWSGTDVAAETSQVVDLPTGSNTNVGFIPGRA